MAMMRCAACSTPLADNASLCTQCGATVYPSSRMGLHPHRDAPPRKRWRLRGGRRAWAALVGVTLLAGGGFWAWYGYPPAARAEMLFAALQAGIGRGEGPGTDPVCVANGLNYDGTPILVEAGNQPTLAWMDVLVQAGLYAPVALPTPVPPASAAGGAPMHYQARPALEHWGGGRRLCIARAVRLEAVRNVGRVQPMRFRGEAFSGVSADVVWALNQPAPWLQAPGVAQALAGHLPAWRGARWQIDNGHWTLVQRRHFFLKDGQWHTAEMLESATGLPPRPAPPG